VQQSDRDRANDLVRGMMRTVGHDNGCAGALFGGVDVGSVQDRVCGRFLAALECVRCACRAGRLGVIEADDQGDGLGRAGIWDVGDGSVAWPGGRGLG
jgi:hypothetical protein